MSFYNGAFDLENYKGFNFLFLSVTLQTKHTAVVSAEVQLKVLVIGFVDI